MAMMKAKYSRKALIIFSIIAILSQLFVSPVLCKSDKQTPFLASFTGSVTTFDVIPINDKLARFHLVTIGSVVSGDFGGAKVTIDEEMLLHLRDGIGLSQGSFTVEVTLPPDQGGYCLGSIFVSFVATVRGSLTFEGHFQIVGGTGLFEKIKGYGTITGTADRMPSLGGIPPQVDGTVMGNYWLSS